MTTFSTNKIILFTVFFSAALMSSLFIFHLRQKQPEVIISSNEGFIFSTGREIKPFELVATNNMPFTQKDFYHHWTLLFFGFTHCASICPTTLHLMNRVYEKLHTSYPNLQVVLISLDPERDSLDRLAVYTHTFNKDFIGVTGKVQELRKLQSQLNILSMRDNASGDNYQLQHTSSILLINPKGRWAGKFNFGMSSEEFIKAFDASIKAIKPYNF